MNNSSPHIGTWERMLNTKSCLWRLHIEWTVSTLIADVTWKRTTSIRGVSAAPDDVIVSFVDNFLSRAEFIRHACFTGCQFLSVFLMKTMLGFNNLNPLRCSAIWISCGRRLIRDTLPLNLNRGYFGVLRNVPICLNGLLFCWNRLFFMQGVPEPQSRNTWAEL